MGRWGLGWLLRRKRMTDSLLGGVVVVIPGRERGGESVKR